MAVIVGKCEHGFIEVAFMEQFADRDDLEEAAAVYFLERHEQVTFGGICEICQRRYLANLRLLDTPSLMFPPL